MDTFDVPVSSIILQMLFFMVLQGESASADGR